MKFGNPPPAADFAQIQLHSAGFAVPICTREGRDRDKSAPDLAFRTQKAEAPADAGYPTRVPMLKDILDNF